MRLDVQSQCLLFYKAGNLLVNFNRNTINIVLRLQLTLYCHCYNTSVAWKIDSI